MGSTTDLSFFFLLPFTTSFAFALIALETFLEAFFEIFSESGFFFFATY